MLGVGSFTLSSSNIVKVTISVINDCNNAVYTGFYRAYAGSANIPPLFDGGVLLFVIHYDSNSVFQYIMFNGSPAKLAIRIRFKDKWEDFKYL